MESPIGKAGSITWSLPLGKLVPSHGVSYWESWFHHMESPIGTQRLLPSFMLMPGGGFNVFLIKILCVLLHLFLGSLYLLLLEMA